MKLHRFNGEGVKAFEHYLHSLSVDPTSPVPIEILSDPAFSLVVPAAIELEPRHFKNRMEAAHYLDGILGSAIRVDVSRDAGLWAWLTLFYFDDVCPVDSGGRRKVGQLARYIPVVADFRKYYRHLLAGPYRVFRAHRSNPERALVLLCGPLHKPGEVVEQIVARQEIITNPQAVELATAIYFDPKTGSFKRGAAGKGGGSARRLADVLNQFDVTWDLYWIAPKGILSKLPKEFDRFRASARA